MRFGLIGSGYWAREVHGAGLAQHPEVDFVGVWGRDANKTAQAASELGVRPYDALDTLLSDVDALTFAVPPGVQADIATRAAGQGLHVLLEKPIATAVSDARRLERAVTDARVASIVFFTRRFSSQTQAWLERLQAQGGWVCGRAEFAASIFTAGGPFADSPWRRDKGALWDVGPHALSVLWPLLGEVTAVVAGAGQGDQVHLVMRHPEGRSSTASLSLTVPQAASATTLYVYGEAGREMAPPGTGDSAGPRAAYSAAVDALIAQAQQPGSGHACDVHFGARVVEVLAAAEESLASGCQVTIRPTL